MIVHKGGIRLHGVHHLVLHAVYVADPILMAAGAPETVITSGMEGQHSLGSQHYAGMAVDLRINTVPAERHAEVIDKLKRALGADYFVLLEASGTPGVHVHIAWRPQAAY